VRPYIFWNLALTSLALAGLALAQQSTRDKNSKAPSTQQKEEPASSQKQESQSLFKNKLGYRSSKGTKESTTLAFNGVDPSGKVDKEMLAKVPTAADTEKVKKMDANRPAAADLKAFLKEGGLKEK
jgi:hypothetical protein